MTQDASTKAISLSVENAESCTLYFDKEKTLSSEDTLVTLGITSNGEKSGFDTPATTDEGVFEMKDDYGMSYYYRGAVTNNYVKFAGFYWRIIRVNGDGSLRIMYDGTQAYANGTYNVGRFIKTGQVYNTNLNDAKYVGWMYGSAGTTASTSKEQAQANVDAAQGDVNTTQSKADSAKKILDGTDAQAIIDQAKAAKGKVAVDKIDVATKEKSAEQASNAKTTAENDVNKAQK